MPHTENVQDFVEKLGDFYETIDEIPPGFHSKPKYWQKMEKPNGQIPQDDMNGAEQNGKLNGSSVQGSAAGGVEPQEEIQEEEKTGTL